MADIDRYVSKHLVQSEIEIYHETHQIDNILSQDPYVGPMFLGVFPRDKLSLFGDGALVINTDPSTKPGEHWIAVFIKNGSAEYFDSYGSDPPKWLKKYWKNVMWTSNPVPLQSPLSAVCGQYCVYYLLHKARGYDMNSLLLNFTDDVDFNDQMVHDFIAERYNLEDLKLIDTNGIISQLARASICMPSIRKLVSGQ